MTHIPCRRLWQVEAVRDGRLSGSDLSNALRHRAECSECHEAGRALDELARSLKALPILATDPLAQRRTRQALLGAWNEHLMAEPRPKFSLRVIPIVAGCAIGGAAFALGYPRLSGNGQGAAASKPQPHAPVAVETTPLSPAALPVPAPPTAHQCSTAASASHPSPLSAAATKLRTEAVKRAPASAEPEPANAEDDAYLEIVDLLRTGREREARSKAVRYLARFPAGFRRPEVEKIAR